MTNEMIGIASVFAFTFFLLMLRHCLLSLGRARRSRHLIPTRPRGHDESNKAVADDSWLFWSSDNEAGSRDSVDEAAKAAHAPGERRRPALRFIKDR